MRRRVQVAYAHGSLRLLCSALLCSALLCSALLCSALLAWGPTAKAELIERVVGIVNDRAILLSDVRQRAAPGISQAMQAPTESQRMKQVTDLYRGVLDRLIDEQLIADAARDLDIRVEQRDIDRAIQNVQAQSGMGTEQFWQAVREQGLSLAAYREDIRRQILRLKVLNQRVRGRVSVREEDIRQRYEDSVRKMGRSKRYNTAHVFVPLADDAGATEVAEAEQKMRQVHQQLSPAGFQQIASEVGGGDLGWLKQGDLPSNLEDTILALEPGEVSQPVRGPSGYHIFLLNDVQRGGGDAPEYAEVREQIYRSMVEQAMAKEEQVFLRELRRKAVIKRRIK